MKCEIIQDLLSQYIDNTCSAETKTVVEEHLKTCEECRKLYKELTSEEFEIAPLISEKKSFEKVKNNLTQKILLVIAVFAILFVFFGSSASSSIMKLRMKNYVKRNYPEHELIMDFIAFRNPEADGFGVNNAYYVAEFISPEQKDLSFAVFTEGRFYFKIVDNYQQQITKRYSTVWRLTDEYAQDIDTLLKTKLQGIYVDCATGLTNDEAYDFSVLNLGQAYSRDVDTIIPIYLNITLYADKEQLHSDDLCKSVIKILKDNGFNTPYLQISLLCDGQTTTLDEIHHLEY